MNKKEMIEEAVLRIKELKEMGGDCLETLSKLNELLDYDLEGMEKRLKEKGIELDSTEMSHVFIEMGLDPDAM